MSRALGWITRHDLSQLITPAPAQRVSLPTSLALQVIHLWPSCPLLIRPYYDFWSFLEYCGVLVFAVDIVLKFFLAYEDPETQCMVTGVWGRCEEDVGGK
jgi:hypothetical protein